MSKIDKSPPSYSVEKYEEDANAVVTHAIITLTAVTNSVWIRRIAAAPWHGASAGRPVLNQEKRP